MNNKYVLEKYSPFNGIEDFYILNNEYIGEKYFLYSTPKVNYSLKIKSNGYVPKSGLIYSKIISNIVKDKKILDLGTGQLGIIAIHSLYCGAKSVKAVDIDKECIDWLNLLINENNLENIETIESNLYDKLSNEKFDIIFSNPPQMPMLSGSKHDSGGEDGRYFILRILKESIIHLNDNGELYILLFDFLGTNIQTNNEESLKNIGKKLGYSKIEIVLETPKIIKENSVTFQSLEHIKKIYPKYSFKEINGNLYFNIQILKFIK